MQKQSAAEEEQTKPFENVEQVNANVFNAAQHVLAQVSKIQNQNEQKDVPSLNSFINNKQQNLKAGA